MALNNKLNILFPIEIDNASLTSSAAQTNSWSKLENILDPRPDKVSQITGTTQTITANANKLDVASAIAIIGHNLSADATIRIQLFDQVNQLGNVVYDSSALNAGTIKPWGEFVAGVDPWANAEWQLGDLIPQAFKVSFSQRAWHSIQIDINDPNAATIQLARLMIGFNFEPNINFARNSRFMWMDTGTDQVKGDKYRLFEFELNRLQDFENDRFEYELIKAGLQGDVLVTLDPSATGLSKLKGTAQMKRITDISRTNIFHNLNRQTIVFKEVY